MTEPWQYLTEAERQAMHDCVRAWLRQPRARGDVTGQQSGPPSGPPSVSPPQRQEPPSDEEPPSHVMAALWALTVDQLTAVAFEEAYRRQVQSRRQAPPPQVEKDAAAWARIFTVDLCTLLGCDGDATQAVRGTLKWWHAERPAGQTDDLTARCADQLAATVLFKHLPHLPRAQPVPLHSQQPPDTLAWGVLMPRVVRHVLLPRLKGRGLITEELVAVCIAAILAAVGRVDTSTGTWQARFTYSTLGEAINFFTSVCDRAAPKPTPQEQRTGAPAQNPPPPAWLPSFAWLSRTLGHTAAIRYWILWKLKRDRGLTWATADQPDTASQPANIASYVLQPECQILDEQDLPPGIAWPEVEQAFRLMAQRARRTPGLLTAEALKKFYSLAQQAIARQLRQEEWGLMTQVLARDEAIMLWVLQRLWTPPRTADEIADQVVQERCGLLDEQALPPGVAWPAVQHAFLALPLPLSETLQRCYRMWHQRVLRARREPLQEPPSP